ncbi:oligopeptide transport system substrate-binding protein [Neobacillus niacini]|uniref:peptide ABC transporter substrate-binding protein n=1 Tax=Neobacillus niacini TaxID=86668 RepID=UPI00277D3AF1|nr:peptide ABC transporter substrate-binding protein [Neobacillus niacini]MDQ1000796.1 oligopeptide transport system substrate-binding protein [Neobacillus niacini]
MKKNLILFFSMFLILIMFISMFYAAFTGRKENTVINNENAPGGASTEVLEQNLRINIRTEPPQLHPGLVTDSISKSVLLQTFEGLTSFNPWGQTINAGAKVIKISDDQKTYTFTLRDTKWSNGDPVTAVDFEYAWKWVLDPANQSANAHQLFYIKGAKAFNEGKGEANQVGVNAINDNTLQVKLDNPTPYFLELLATPAFFPIHSKVARENPSWANGSSNQYISNGPFKLSEWHHGEKIFLKKNNNYWDSNVVKLKEITMLMINDPITELSMYNNDELDWAGSPTGFLPMGGVMEVYGEEELNTREVAGIYSYKLNTTVEPFNNVNIRKAFALAINRQELVDFVALKGKVPAMSIVPPNMSLGSNSLFNDSDVSKAKQYMQQGLEELGYKDVSELPAITLSIGATEEDIAIAQAIQKMWKNHLGIDIRIKNMELKEHIQNVQALKYQVVQDLWIGDFKDPINFLDMYREAEYRNNGTGWESKKFQSLLEQSKKELDVTKRQDLLKNAEAVLIDQMPVIPLYFYSYNWLQKDNLINPDVSGLGQIKYKWASFQ